MSQVFAFLGGLGIFLFGIKLTGESLKLYAGDRLRILIDRHTSNPIKGVFVGAMATVAMQTSTGTTALTISLVKSGQMKLRQAISVIMGANVGTTMTAFLIGLRISDYALPIIFVGSMMYNFSHKHKTNLLGQVLIGFGSLFLGLVVMQGPLRPLAASPAFEQLMVSIGNVPILGVFLGIGLTLIVQSSSAMIGIIQTLYSVDGIAFYAATAMVMGSNVGTTITAIIASAGGNKTTKQAALSHVLFNTFGLIIFFIILFVFNGIVIFENIFETNNVEPMMQLAYIHGMFSVVTAMILLPFINQLEKLVTYMIKDEQPVTIVELEESVLNVRIIDESPAFALRQVKQAILICIAILAKQLEVLEKFSKNPDKKLGRELKRQSIMLNKIVHKIQIYFSLLISKNLDTKGLQSFSVYSSAAKDLERISELSLEMNTRLSSQMKHLNREFVLQYVLLIKTLLATTNNIYFHKGEVTEDTLIQLQSEMELLNQQISISSMKLVHNNSRDEIEVYNALKVYNDLYLYFKLLHSISSNHLGKEHILDDDHESIDVHEYVKRQA